MRVTQSSETLVRPTFSFTLYSEITLSRIFLPSKYPSEQPRKSADPFFFVLCIRGYVCRPEVQFHFFIFSLMLTIRSSVISIGAFAARGRPGPILIFVFIWTTLVYDPIAHSIWSKRGWANRLGVLDFSGGTPVHISSGTAALVISIYLGRRSRGDTVTRMYKPSNPTNVVLGTVLLTFGE